MALIRHDCNVNSFFPGVRCVCVLLSVWTVALLTEWQQLNPAANPANNGKLDLCFVCFGPCEQFIEKFMTESKMRLYGWQPQEGETINMVDEYFRLVTEKVAQAATTLDPKLTVNYRKTYQKSKMLWLSHLTTSRDSSAISKVNKVFSISGLQKGMRARYQCDVTFLTSDPNDPVFVASGVQGIAYSGAVCQDDSSGIVSLHDNIYTEASILAHELGHLLMLSHDTVLPTDDTTNLASDPALAPAVDAVLSACRGTNDYGCSHPSGNCVMSREWRPDALTFSDCSRKYYELFKDLVREYEGFYEMDCFKDTNA